MTETMTYEQHPLLSLVPEGSTQERLRSLLALGTPVRDLVEVAESLTGDLGVALMALPVPLCVALRAIPAADAELALLGFTVSELLDSEIVAQDLRTAGWRDFPTSLSDLYNSEHPHILQVIYLGTLLAHPQDVGAWERAVSVMRALDHGVALQPVFAPPVGPVSDLYDEAVPTEASHPFIYFSRKRL